MEPVNPSPESQSLWYYADAANQPVGPLPFSDLQQLAAAGVIQPETHVIEKDGTEWKKFALIVPPPAFAETKPASADIPLSSAAAPANESAADGFKHHGKEAEEFFHKCGRGLKAYAVIAADKSKRYWKNAEEFFDNYKRGLEAQANKRADKAVPDKFYRQALADAEAQANKHAEKAVPDEFYRQPLAEAQASKRADKAVPEPGEQPTEKKQPATKETVQGGALFVPLATEAILYSDPQLAVTSRRVVIGETTYSLRNITSVTMKTTTPNGCCPGCLIFFCGFVLCLAFFDFSGFCEALSGGHWTGFAAFSLFVVFFVAGIAWFRSLKPSFHVTIASASGEVQALESAEKDYIQKIVTSINDAIANHHS